MYDRSMLKTFVWSSSLYPIGCKVDLADGRLARVVSATADPKRPVVKLLTGSRSGQAVNLTQHRKLSIAGGTSAAAGPAQQVRKT